MSKSLKRVRSALETADVPFEILAMQGETRTAADAAREVGCQIDQIAKSIIFRGTSSGSAVLFVTAGGNQVDAARAAKVAGEQLERADAVFVRTTTGFAIGGVAPIGHLNQPRVFLDPKLLDFDVVYAAAGTPKHVFSVQPDGLARISKAQIIEFV